MGLANTTVGPRPALLLGLLLLVLLLAAGGDTAREWLRYERSGIEAGQLWRLLTAHLVHLGAGHAILNAAGLVLVAWLYGPCLSFRQWLLAGGMTVAGIDAAFWLLEPRLDWYVGLSGLLHGLLAAGIVVRFGAARAEAVGVGLLLATKLAWEQLAGALPGSIELAGGAVVVDAHLYGAIAGLVAGLAVTRSRAAGPL